VLPRSRNCLEAEEGGRPTRLTLAVLPEGDARGRLVRAAFWIPKLKKFRHSSKARQRLVARAAMRALGTSPQIITDTANYELRPLPSAAHEIDRYREQLIGRMVEGKQERVCCGVDSRRCSGTTRGVGQRVKFNVGQQFLVSTVVITFV
jgi:hypothetical protein